MDVPDVSAALSIWAHWYAAQGWPIFPCHGKAPITRRGFYDATCDAAQIASWWAQWPDANIGAPMGRWAWALDEDPRNGGDSTRADLERSYAELPTTMTSLSGRKDGGCHRFFLLPPGGLKHKAALGDGLDVIGLGGYVILPPSIHPDTGLPYEWEYGPDEMRPQEAPAWLEALVTSQAPPSSAHAPAAPGEAIPQGTRDTTLTRMAGSMRRQGATATEILAALEVMNQRCVPPVSPDDLARIAHSVERYAPAPQLHVTTPPGTTTAVETPAWDSSVPWDDTQWRTFLSITKGGQPKQTFANLVRLLEHCAPWSTTCWYDTLRELPMVGETPLTDHGVKDAALVLGEREEVPITNLALVQAALVYLCQQHQRDPLQEFLATLPAWDGTERLTEWLSDHAHVPKTAYTMEVSRLLPVAMIARALDPGCQYRSVVIFEGPEDTGKSKLVKALAGAEWYRELSSGFEGKEAHMLLQGVWVAELAELAALRKTEEARLKSFITMQADDYVPKFSNLSVSRKRRTVFVGTHNPEGDGTFLRGQTGNTRFLPIAVQAVAVEDVLAIREQLLAEALVYYHAHPADWWQLSDEGASGALEAREDRRQASVFQEALGAWLQGEARVETTWEDVARHFLFAPKDRWTRAMQMEIASALRGLGWVIRIEKTGGKSVRKWRRRPGEV